MDSESCHVSGWKEMKDVLARMTDSDVEMMLEGSRHQTPPRLSDVLKLENLKEMRMTELKEFQNKHSKFWDPGNIVESSLIPIPFNVTSEFWFRSEVRKIIFVSSEVPAYDLLICSLQHDVVHSLYDFNSSTPDSLVFKLHSITRRAQHTSNIGFFTHHGKPGEFLLTKHLKMTRGCSTLEEMIKFFKTVTGLLRDEGGCVDIFQPVACCEEMRQSLITLSSNCGVEFRSPMNVFDDNQIYDGPWFSTSNSSPPNVPSNFYFDRGRFMMWSNDLELMGEACNEVKSNLHGYFAGIRRQLISRAVGEVIRTSLGFVDLEKMEKLLGELTNGILVLQDCPEDEIHIKLGKHLLGKSGHEHSETIDEDEVRRRKFDKSWIDAAQGSSLHPGEKRQLSSRSNQLKILDELISSEKYYNDCMRSLVDVYKRPIVVSLETNRALVSWQNARLLFDDVTQLFGISCQFLEDLKLMRINPSSQIFLGQLTLRFLKSFASLLSAYLLVYSAILDTYDKCKRQCTSFRAFLKRYESSPSSLMLSLPELYMKPWKRVNEYARMLTSYRDVLRHDHPDIRDLDACIHSIGELADSIDESVKRLISDHKMMTLQDKIKNCPQLNESRRHLIMELRASHMLAPCQSTVPELRVYRHSGDLHFYLFDDCLVCADVVVRNFPFKSRRTEEQIFLQTSSIRFIRIKNIPDSQSQQTGDHFICMQHGFKMSTPNREWICSVDDDATKFDWISTLERTVKLHFNQ